MKIVQVLDALDFGDGVSNDVINKYNLLKEMGYDTDIYSKWHHEKVGKYRKDIKKLNLNENDILIHHFSGECHCLKEIQNQKCKKILVYHNITPNNFFDFADDDLSVGESQLKEIKENYDYFLADSQFNVISLKKLGVKNEIDVLPILIDFNRLNKYKNNIKNKKNDRKIFLFVGRVAENKKHEDIIRIFNYYYKNIDCNSDMIFVGNTEFSKLYYEKLTKLVDELELNDNITFTGKVDDNIVYDYYNNADVFICMSEHEGFCIPLLESMYFGVPTIAYNSTAIESTMGDAGILVEYKNSEVVAKMIYEIINDIDINKKIIQQQYKWVRNFYKENIKIQLYELINKWSGR